MASSTYKWTCRWCHQSDGCLDYSPFRDRVKCLLCLRVERAEDCINRNIKVEFANPQWIPNGVTYALQASDFFLLRDITT